MPKSRLYILALTFLVIVGFQGVFSAWKTGQTTDEAYFTASGYAMVRYNNYDFLGEQPPLIAQLIALPLLILQPEYPIKNPVYLQDGKTPDISQSGIKFLYKMGNHPQMILFLQRLPIVCLMILLGWFIFLFSLKNFGEWAGFISLGLYAFDPNILAHGSLSTMDMGLTAFYFFSIFALQTFFNQPTLGRAGIVGVLCGAAFLSKISGLILFPVILILFTISYLTDSRSQMVRDFSVSTHTKLGVLALFLLSHSFGQKQPMVTLGCMCLLMTYLCFENRALWARLKWLHLIFKLFLVLSSAVCFFFAYKLKKKYGLHASIVFLGWNAFAALFSYLLLRVWRNKPGLVVFVKLFIAIWLVAGLAILLDYTDWVFNLHRFVGFGHFAQPLGIVLAHSVGGHKICIEGSFVTCDWRYFFSVGLIKIPLLTLSLGLMGLIALISSKKTFLVKALVLIPSGLFLAAAALNGINIGLRHVLPVYPFFIVLGGYLGGRLIELTNGIARKFVLLAFAVSFVFFAMKTVQAAPDYLSYFNELVSGTQRGAELVADSNLNWGQDNARLAEFVKQKSIPQIKIQSEAQNPAVYDYYKINWDTATEKDLLAPAPGFYALGIGVYQSLQKNSQSWFNGKAPQYAVGKTFYVFFVPS